MSSLARTSTVRIARRQAQALQAGAVRPALAARVISRPATTVAGELQKPRKSLLRRFLTTSILLTTIFYSGSVFAASQNDRYHDFFVESVPMGEAIMDYFDETDFSSEKKRLTGQVNRALSTVRGNAETEKEKVSDKAKEAAAAAKEKVGAAKAQVRDRAQEASAKATDARKAAEDKTKSAADQAKAKADEEASKIASAASAAKAKVVEVKDQASEAVQDLAHKAEAALGIDGKSTGSSQVSANLSTQTYNGPIPLDFEPPPGYVAPRGRALKAKEADGKAKPIDLPLVAPSVRDVSRTEPILGQLASTIDSLAFFLRDHPHVVSTEDEAKKILSTAQADLEGLGARLQSIKEAERVRLSGQLEDQAQSYNRKLEDQERALYDKFDKQEAGWKAAVDAERQELIAAYRQKLDAELQVQQELIEQRLKEEVIGQGIELQRRWIRDIKTRVEQERGGRLGRLDHLERELRSLERVTLDNSEYLDENIRIHRLWSAIRSVVNAAVGEGDSRQKRPFAEQFRGLQGLAARSQVADNESPIAVALDTVPESTAASGVDSLPFLSTWFTHRLVPRIKLAALLPENGGFFSYAASAALSTLLFRKDTWTDGQDVMSVLGRAEWYLAEKDLDGAAREVNSLQGWPKVLARDWLQSARKHLEVRQALEVAETEATLESLLVL